VVTGVKPGATTVLAQSGSKIGTATVTIVSAFEMRGQTLAVGGDNWTGGHTCAIAQGGELYCWGNNQSSQLGDGTSSTRLSPTLVTSGQRFRSVAAAVYGTCAIDVDGTVHCWGGGLFLGNGTRNGSAAPVPVPLTEKASAIAMGRDHVCALVESGDVYCWGGNWGGAIGNGQRAMNWDDPAHPLVPYKIPNLKFFAIAATTNTTCGLLRSGEAMCWGSNDWGGLGNGGATPTYVPTPVLGGYTFTAITGSGSVSGTFCAQTDVGIIYCWGDNSGNKYSASGGNSIPSAALFSGVDIRSLTLGEQHACGIAANGTGYCWGTNILGSLGVTSPSSSSTPIALSLGGLPSLIVAGGIHSCAILADGTMRCWGQNFSGALGNGTTSGKASPPAPIIQDRQFSTISSGRQKTCGLDSTGKAYCWGEGWEIDNMSGVRATPSEVPVALTFASISAENGQHACAVRGNGEAWCWGGSWDGQLGGGSTGSTSIQRAATSQPLSRISTGNSHTCALSTANSVLCWGRGSDGQIGDGSNVQRLSPTVVSGFSFTAVSSGDSHTCALTAEGVAHCWGRNSNGQLGDGSTQNRNRPTAVLTTLRFTSINAGRDHTCGIALSPVGRVYCWGAGWDGRLGNGVNSGNFTTPSSVTSTLAFSSIDAGASHTCGITTTAETYCWGSNRDLRLGYPESLLPNGYSDKPVRVLNDPGFVEITTSGDRFTCGRTAAKVTHCWGANASAVLTAAAEAPASVSSGGTKFKTSR